MQPDRRPGLGYLLAAGVAFAVAAAVTFAVYLVGFERAGRACDAFTTLAGASASRRCSGCLRARRGLAVRRPRRRPQPDAGVGTLLPVLINVAALRHLPAARVGVVATLEPVLATLIACRDWASTGARRPLKPRGRRPITGGP